MNISPKAKAPRPAPPSCQSPREQLATIGDCKRGTTEFDEGVEEVEIVEDNVGDEAPAPTMEPEVKEEIAIPAAISPPSEPEFELKEEVEIVEDKAPVVAPVAEEPKEVEPVFGGIQPESCITGSLKM